MILKIRTKILAAMLIIGVLAALPITFISMNSLIRSSKDQAKDFGVKSAFYNSEIINTWLSEKAKMLMELKIQLKSPKSDEEIIKLLRMYSGINKDFISIFIGTDDNRMLDAYGWIPDESYKVTERPWFRKAVNQENYVTTSAYRDVNKQENVIAIASGVDLQGHKGVIAANIYVDYILEIIDDIKYGENGFAVLLDDTYNLITGPKDAEKIAAFNHIFESIGRKAQGFEKSEAFEIEVAGVEYIAAYSSIEGFDWSLFLVAPLSDFINSAYTMRNQMIQILLGILVIIFIIDFALSRTISRPIETLVNCVSGIAKGNFDIAINIRTQDEIGKLSKELDKMRINLKTIFESLKYESKIISMNSQNLAKHLDETFQGTSRFMSMLSHDIKTPITLIKGYSKALSMEMVDREKAKDYIERIQYRSEQIENIVEDILDNTYEANDIRVNLKEIKVSDYINMIMYNTENYVNNQKHQLIEKIDYEGIDLEGTVAIDITKIQRVINNILSNAVKFSEDDSVIELIINEADGRILTCIKDYGTGIKDEEQEKVFNMFYKADDSKKGYGLGLYINKSIIEAHNGEIFFESVYQQGTTSGFYLNIIKKS
ncbi:MAG TPA: sensor histidine kinase [Bacillota bacterium]|nr:sensor histidine kinase [Bacillota bacterium]HRS20447.1 sensor histidine kinase [Clostridia bacterium]HRU41116.1 sensor histidine kinase [Candidatus Diapherotrites archaeon]HQE66750.1 sensor histidine kinase [Bacillota bacterium]HQI15730.1 sensor histidine kinase [Bacillota bacterium]